MKKLLVIIFISVLFLTGCGDKIEENQAIVKTQYKNTVYLYNMNGTSNDDDRWTQLDLYKSTSKDYSIDAMKMKFQTGDIIRFRGKSFSGWHEITEIKVISHNAEIPDGN